MRVVNVVEKSVFNDASQKPVPVPANTSTDVLASITTDPREFAGRYVFNAGSNPCYYRFDATCDTNNYNGVLASQQQLDCSNHSCRVNVYSIAGTVIAPTVLIRADLVQQQNIGVGNFKMP